MPSASLETLEGAVERVTFRNDENGYSVVRLRPRRGDVLTVVGNLPEVQPGESLRLTGTWMRHPEFGPQFKAVTCEQVLPATVEGLRRYLGSGLVKGVGPRTAERIVKHFGMETLRILDEDPERLLEVPSIGRKRVDDITRAWREQQAIKDVMLFLQSHGVTTALAVRIYKQYGDESIRVVQGDPYRLAREVFGIGFLTADRIATSLGVPHDAPARIEAGVLHTLSKFADEGHVYAPRDELVGGAAELLSVDPALVTAALDRLRASDAIVVERLRAAGTPGEDAQETDAVYLKPFYYAEIGAANSLRAMLASPRSRLAHSFQGADWPKLLARVVAQPHMTVALSEQQQLALRTALTHKVTVLTGGPGTGKTTTMRALIAALELYGHSYALASPTGRAAKRLAEAALRPAMTIHRLLGWTPDGFQHDATNPLSADMVIVDETSMLDLLLANHLFKAVHPDAHLLLVGDIDQLPAVGAGNVLRDLIQSGRVAVVRLETIFRQAAESLIIVNSHRVLRGQPLHTPADAHDFFVFVKDDPVAAADLIVDLVSQRIPQKFGLDPLDDIQVLSPMHRGDAGVTELNRRLQAALNPAAPGKAERPMGAGHVYRVGDRVMQTRNAYDREVFNGDVGRIAEIDPESQTITAEIDGRRIEYDWATVDELMPAFCCSIHKAQGSEYPAVVIPVLTQHYRFLQRNLLYTGITRARRLVVLVGSRKAIAIALKNNEIAQRWSALDYRLAGSE